MLVSVAGKPGIHPHLRLNDPILILPQTVLMVLRIYALYNRDSVVLWVLGTHLVFSVVVCVMLVRRFFVAIANGYLFNALCQRWIWILQDEMIPDEPPPIPGCVPYRSSKQCVFCRTLPRYRYFYSLAIRAAEEKVGCFVPSSCPKANPPCCRK